MGDATDPQQSEFDSAALEAEIERFEAAWSGDVRPLLEEFLTGVGPQRAALLRELVAIDLEYRLQRGEPARVENYLTRFPELSHDDSFCLDFIVHEFETRRLTDPHVSIFEYIERFPKFGSELRNVEATLVPRPTLGRGSRFSARLNCPHCHNPIEIVTESADEEVVCPSCGSTLHLDSSQTMTWDKQRLPHIEHFKLLEAVGRGAFGTVYKARDNQLQRLVAIKIPRSGVLATDEDEDRFVREARNAAQLQHPGIVTVFSVGRTETFPYLVSEFVDGVTLAQFLTAKRFTMRDAARLIQDIALGLQHAHEHGVIHRDLKPSNIMLTPEGQPRIMDFGLAKRDAGEITMTLDGRILGTPAYMSPEQAKGEAHNADARSDIYSVGVILFQLLTGELPFRGDTRMLLHQVIHDEAPNARRLNDKVPRDLDTICQKCLTKEPQRRYASARDLADDLGRFLDGHPILARPVGAAQRAWRWARRNPSFALMYATILLLVTSIAIGSTVGVFVVAEQKRQAVVARDRENVARQAETKQLAEVKRQKQLVDGQRKTAIAAQIKASQERDRANLNAERERQQRQRADAKEREARRSLYAAHMHLAQAAWEDNRLGRVLQLLELYGPGTPSHDLRGFEWYYWDRLCHSEILTLAGHRIVAFSPDGSRIATGGGNNAVTIWDLKNTVMAATLKGHAGGITSIAFSPDGKRIASACGSGKVKFWDVATGNETATVKGHEGPVWSIAFSPDGNRLASASSDGTVKLWDADSGEETAGLTVPKEVGPIVITINGRTTPTGFEGVAFSPNGATIAAGNNRNIILWDLASGRQTKTFKGQSGGIKSVAFSPEGNRIASAISDGTVNVWDVSTGEVTATLKGHAEGVYSVAFSPDGKQLASASEDQTAKLWDIATGKETMTFKGHTAGVWSVAFSPDGSRLASASEDQTVKIWGTAATPETATLTGPPGWISGVAFSRDGKRIASAAGYSQVNLWDVSTFQQTATLEGHSNMTLGVAFSPDNARVASASSDGTVKVWDVVVGAPPMTLTGHTGWVQGVAFSPDSTRIASASHDKTIKLWDAVTGREIATLKGHTYQVWGVTFSPDGSQIASASADKTAKLWDVASGRETATLKGHTQQLTSVAFSPDGSRVASASNDNSIKLWDAATGRETATLKGHTSGVLGVAFSPDGMRLVSGSRDETVKIWDATNGQELATLKGHTARVTSVAFNSEGTRIASAGADGAIKIWDARAWTPELRAEESARFLIDKLFNRLKFQDLVSDAINADSNLPLAVRVRASTMASAHRDKPSDLDHASISVVMLPDQSKAQYELALRHAEKACRLEPDNGLLLNTLGLAQYRVGNYEAAAQTLTRSTELNTKALRHRDKRAMMFLAFLAMAQHQLGRSDDAHSTLNRMRELVNGNGSYPPATSFLREAENLITPAASPKSPK